jgi:hypothetical protein
VGAATGGALLALGAWLPWLTLYGGLHPLRGTMGAYGQVMFAGGVAAAAGAALVFRRPHQGGIPLLLGAAGAVAFLGWLLVSGLPAQLEVLRENPFLVAATGPGPRVALAGALLLMAAGWAARSHPERCEGPAPRVVRTTR